MARVVIIGNASGGKSTLARKLASGRDLPLTEIDQLLWQPGWKLTPPEIYERRHAEIIKQEAWVIEGLGSQGSIPERMARATEIILIDLPLWVHFWLLLHEPLASFCASNSLCSARSQCGVCSARQKNSSEVTWFTPGRTLHAYVCRHARAHAHVIG
jgi:adenylate kinase family enzyme